MAAGSSETTVRKGLECRRKSNKPALKARLTLDDGLKSNVGFLSDNLFRELFPDSKQDGSTDCPLPISFLAISPSAPGLCDNESAWSIVPVLPSTSLDRSVLQLSSLASNLDHFTIAVQNLGLSKIANLARAGIDIAVLDVTPTPLTTVFVRVDSEAMHELQPLRGKLSQTHPSFAATAADDPASQDLILRQAIKSSLSRMHIIHTGALLPHVSSDNEATKDAPSKLGRIVFCEPVAQGVLTNATKIILQVPRSHPVGSHRPKAFKPAQRMSGISEDQDDVPTDSFYSAAEQILPQDGINSDLDEPSEMETNVLRSEKVDDLSDDSIDDVIALDSPLLPLRNMDSQIDSPLTIGAWRGRKTNGATTPGSVYSTFTSATAYPERQRGRLFNAHGLKGPISPESLHPRPGSGEDEEARVYVHTALLPSIGCFSGDWVRIDVVEDTLQDVLPNLRAVSPDNGDDEPKATWRPVRIYALPDRRTTRRDFGSTDYRMGGSRRGVFADSGRRCRSRSDVYASPILLANLGNAERLRISALARGSFHGQSKLTRSSQPPFAKDLVIHHVRSPISTERVYQTAVLGGLKRYFAHKTRLVRTGDLIAVPVDSQLGRALQERKGVTGSEVDDVAALAGSGRPDGPSSSSLDCVAWFRIGHIQMQRSTESVQSANETLWGSVASIDSSTVGMHGSGSVTSRIPGSLGSPWPFYLGLKRAPRHDLDERDTSASSHRSDPSLVAPLRQQLRQLLSAATSPKAIQLRLPPVAILLTSAHRNVGKSTLASTACADIGLHTYPVDAFDILSEGGSSGGDVKSEGFLRTRAERAVSCGPDCCALLIKHIDVLTADRIESTLKEILADVRVLIATTCEVDQVPDGVRGLFSHEFDLGAPDEAEREAILQSIVEERGISLEPAVRLKSIALKTAALVAGDLVDVVERARVAQQARVEQLAAECSGQLEHRLSVRDIRLAGGPAVDFLTAADFEVAVEAARKNFSDAIGAPKIPNVTWEDVGGLDNVKEAITETIQLPLERPELFAKGMKKRSGILFYGPPGTGKTLLAKAIATEYSLNFFSVKGPELLNMYIGESEANVRRVFQRARDARPCVVFFDELDSVAPKRGNQGDSGGVMDRIVSQLLAELDGMSGGEEAGGVFVIGATNRPDLLDPALLRPGRFDKMLYLGVSDTHEKQLTILEALTRKFALDRSVSLGAVAERLPFTYTGADFYALCSDAMLKAVTRQASRVDARVAALNAARSEDVGPISTAQFFDHHASAEDLTVTVTEADFSAAQAELIPSVSAGELAHYDRVRAVFEGAPRRAEAGGKGQSKAAPPLAATRASDGGARDGEAERRRRSKGKGKAVMGFAEGGASDDDDLY